MTKRDHQQAELISIIEQNAPQNGINPTVLPGVSCYRETAVNKTTPNVYNPSLCVVAQGAKQVMLGEKIHQFRVLQFLVVSVDLPIVGTITQGSPEKPYLCIKIDLDLQLISELALSMHRHQQTASRMATQGLLVGQVDSNLSDCVLRLARLIGNSEDREIMAPLLRRELHYRFLQAETGSSFVQYTLLSQSVRQVFDAIQIIKSGFRQKFSVPDLADAVGMSESALYAHFKNLTTMSPLQYQKQLRLIHARQVMLADAMSAADTAYHVGYESPSQFSREYARMFGSPPARDISRIRQQITPGDRPV